MQDGSQLLGHVRYPCTYCNAISHKVEKEKKPHGKNPPPKREMKREDAWMDGVIKTPHYNIHQVHTKVKNEKDKNP